MIKYTDERDVVPAGRCVRDAGAHRDHNKEEGDEESNPVVALVGLDVKGGKGAVGEQAQRNVVHQ